MNIIPDVFNYVISPFLSDSDHLHFQRTCKRNNSDYKIKKYRDEYNIKKVPIRYHSKLTNIVTNNVDRLPALLTHLTIYGEKGFNQPVNQLPASLTHLTIYGNGSFN